MKEVLQYLDHVLAVGLQLASTVAVHAKDALSLLTPQQLLISAGALVMVIFVLLLALVVQRSRLIAALQEREAIAQELAEVIYELNVERVWRLAGEGKNAVPEDTLNKLYQRINVGRAVV